MLDTTGIQWAKAQIRQASRAAVTSTPDGVPLAALPLTGQLEYPRSPMSQFLARHLPRTDRLVASYLRQSRGFAPAVQPMDERRPDYAALGRTIDYRLRLSLGCGLGGAVTTGVRLLGSTVPIQGAPPPDARRALHTAGTRLHARIQAHLEGAPRLGEEELTRLCHVAGFFEAVYRNGVFSRRRNLLAHADARTTLAHLTAAVPTYVVEDIAEQMELAERPFTSLRQLLPETAGVRAGVRRQ
ncbi:hypothetical protein EJ357_00765 [Streptomyces cyaneochromogenes]|uniref:Uncharacterized protein n=1 Tax=Streptomyces cyaneochromogenes TaxID=2496836 RepID=A0A3S5HT59_9ACTN|nr:hypothetical protein [Streptomyces cyaneochromogenes]AZQ32186.1 hypothetical protein EJ357_00765 [Streptomyces cyaneochromogenes]